MREIKFTNKRAGILNQVVAHIILIGIIFAIFVFATAGKINARDFKQQIVEKQTALFIDSAVPGMSFEIDKKNLNGEINSIEVRKGAVFATVEGFRSLNGYPYFSPYRIEVEGLADKFIVRVK
jgi:hypothetical protein